MIAKLARTPFFRAAATGLAALALSIAAPRTEAKDPKLFFHLFVSSPKDSEHVRINLPITLAEAMLPTISSDHLQDGHFKIDFNGEKLTAKDFRNMWEAAREIEDGEFITVQSKGDDVHISRQGAYMLVNAQDEDAKVEVKVPVAVVDALFSGEEDELDLAAGLKALKAQGPGELLTVTDGPESVRIWIDEKATAED